MGDNKSLYFVHFRYPDQEEDTKNTLSQMGPATVLLVIILAVSNAEPRLTLTLAMFTLGVGCNGALYSGWIINTQDIAPNFAGTVLGLTNCMGAIPGFVAPSIASQITHEDVKDTHKWDTVWLITIVILTLESIFYIIFADGEPQSWNHPDKDYEEKAKTKKRDWFLVSNK